jgi:hypothetical protein
MPDPREALCARLCGQSYGEAEENFICITKRPPNEDSQNYAGEAINIHVAVRIRGRGQTARTYALLQAGRKVERRSADGCGDGGWVLRGCRATLCKTGACVSA